MANHFRSILLFGYFLIIQTLQGIGDNGNYLEYNEEIMDSLKTGYDPKAIPPRTPVQVFQFVRIDHIESVNETEETIKLHGSVFMMWKDDRLKWNPSKFNQTSSISFSRIGRHHIWTPELKIINRADGKARALSYRDHGTYIRSNGMCHQSGAFSIKSACNFDYSAYPYDTQKCPIVFYLNAVNVRFRKTGAAMAVFKTSGKVYEKKQRMQWTNSIKSPDRRVGRNWIVTGGTRNFSYYSYDGLTYNESQYPSSESHMMNEIWIHFKRQDPYYTVRDSIPQAFLLSGLKSRGRQVSITTVIPLFSMATVTLCAILVTDFYLSLSLLLTSSLLHPIFISPLLADLPPAAGALPKIVHLFGLSMGSLLVVFAVRIGLARWKEVGPAEPTDCYNIKRALNLIPKPVSDKITADTIRYGVFAIFCALFAIMAVICL